MISATSNAVNNDPGVIISERPPFESDSLFCVFPPNLLADAVPIFDEQTGACIGYSHERAKGFWIIYNSFGDAVGMEELPLESSPIAPEDVLLLGLTLFKIGRMGWTASRSVDVRRVSTAGVRFAGMLRNRLLAPSTQQLKFARTPAEHMLNPGRYVPAHIQRLAIKYGKRIPDPQGAPGVFLYKAPMAKLFKRMKDGNPLYQKETRELEVLVRESDWTILHFLYR
jgi:hypothetical protein